VRKSRSGLFAIAAALAVCGALAACGVKGDPTLPEGVKDTKPFPRTYPEYKWPTVAKPKTAPAESPSATPGAQQQQ
jgi:hypothetical protein